MHKYSIFVYHSNVGHYVKFRKNPSSGDPSRIQQSFEKIDINVHCCRYWWLKRWKHQRLSFPYWRLYWNKANGAYVFYEQMVRLNTDKIILIPPYTPFYTDILHTEDNDEDQIPLEGGWINSRELEKLSLENGFIPHFFIHFNLGYRFDSIRPGIYPLAITPAQRELIDSLTDHLMAGRRTFSLMHSVVIYRLIMSAIIEIPADSWMEFNVGSKIQKVLGYIDQNLRENLSNEMLASLIHMAPNSFARLFKQQTGHPPQDYIRRKRVEHAIKLLYHTEHSIKQISEECGFQDRYYFTRVFTRIMGSGPAGFRKKFQMDQK
jgi:AraC-like DNA-binding protein